MTHEEIHALLAQAEHEEMSGLYSEAEAHSRVVVDEARILKTSADSVCRALLVLSKSLWRQGMASEALPYAEEALALVQELDSDEVRGKLYSNLGNIYSDISDFSRAIEYYQTALTINEALGLKVEIARNLGNMGLAHAEMLNYVIALKYYQQALALNEELGRKVGIAKNLGNIGLMYWNLLDFTHAIDYYTKSLALHEELGSTAGIAITLGNLGNTYFNLTDYPTSLYYLQRALELFESIGDKYGIASNLGNIGNIYSDTGDYPSAIEYLERARLINRELGNKSGEAVSLGNIGGIYANTEFHGYDPKIAEEYLLEAVQICESIENKRDQFEFYLFLSDLYTTLHRWQEALECHKHYHELEKTVHSEEASKQTQRYAIEQDVAVIQREQEVLHIKNAELAAINLRLEESNRQLIQVNIEKNEFLGIAAHDLKNPLNVITMVSGILQDEAHTLSPIEIKDLADDIRSSSQHMFDLIVSVLDVNKIERGGDLPAGVLFSVQECIRIITERFATPSQNKRITLESQAEDVLLQAHQPTVLQVLDNLVSNALKFSNSGAHIIIEAVVSSDDYIRFGVKDEGPGLTEEDKLNLFGKFKRLSAQPTGGEHSSGLGLSIVKRLVEMLNGRIWCESEPGKGATFFVELPARQG